MKKYHITFRVKPEDETATGKNFEDCSSEMDALIKFREQFPNAVFIYMACEDMFTHKYCLSLSPVYTDRNKTSGE